MAPQGTPIPHDDADRREPAGCHTARAWAR